MAISDVVRSASCVLDRLIAGTREALIRLAIWISSVPISECERRTVCGMWTRKKRLLRWVRFGCDSSERIVTSLLL